MRVTLGFRALASLAGGMVITFSQSKGPLQVLLVLAGLAIAQVLALAIGALVKVKRDELLSQMPLATFAAIIAVLALLNNSNTAEQFDKARWLLIIWGLISGAFGVWQVRRLGFASRAGKDWAISAGLALALAGTYLLIPQMDIITMEGLFGAYLVIDGVHLALAATGPRSQGKPTAS